MVVENIMILYLFLKPRPTSGGLGRLWPCWGGAGQSGRGSGRRPVAAGGGRQRRVAAGKKFFFSRILNSKIKLHKPYAPNWLTTDLGIQRTIQKIPNPLIRPYMHSFIDQIIHATNQEHVHD